MAEPQQLLPVYLLTGSDRPKVERALGRLRSRFDAGAVELRAATDTSGEDAVAACNTLGLLGAAGRLVVVADVERWKAADHAALSAYLRDPAPDAVLALVAGELRRDSPLVKLAAGHGDVLRFDVAKRDYPAWVAEQFRRLGAQADPAACRALVELVGEDLTALSSEVEKLAAWAGGEAVDDQAVELLAVAHGDPSPFALGDAWGARDAAALLRAAERMLERSADPPATQIPRLAGALTQQVARVARAHRLAARGVAPRSDEALRALSDTGRPAHPFVAEKAFAQARNYSAEELDDALARLADLDVALKGGSRLPARLQLERALVDVVGAESEPATAASRR